MNCDVANTRPRAVEKKPGEYLSFNPEEPYAVIFADTAGADEDRADHVNAAADRVAQDADGEVHPRHEGRADDGRSRTAAADVAAARVDG